jgi:hypothetical protein
VGPMKCKSIINKTMSGNDNKAKADNMLHNWYRFHSSILWSSQIKRLYWNSVVYSELGTVGER